MHISFYKRPLFLILIIYSLVLVLCLKPPQPKQGDVSFSISSSVQNIEAEIISYPVSKKGDKSFTAEVLSINNKPSHGKAYVYCAKCPDITRGEKIFFTGKIAAVTGADNFGSFNWPEYLARKHTFCQIETGEIEKTEVYSGFWVAIAKIRNSILNVFESNFDGELLPILSGITIGEKGDISRALYSAFQDSGAMHLLVASGGNVGFVTLIVYFLCSLFGAGRFTSAGAALVLALFYTLIAGADAPLLRAYLMTLSATIGFMMGRKSGVLQGFIIAALLILIVNPQSLFEAGFQMSFLATLSIIFLVCNFKLSSKIPKYMRVVLELFLVSFVAQLALLPIFTNYFYKVSFAAVFSNIILVPLSGLIMAGGFIVWVLSLLHLGFIFKGAVFVLTELLILFRFFVEYFAGFYLSKIPSAAMSPFAVTAYFTGLFALFNLPLVKRKIIYLSVTSAIIAGLLIAGGFMDTDAVHVLSGRYNDAVMIKHGKSVKVIGGGIEGDILTKSVFASGTRKINCLFINGLSNGSFYGLRNADSVKIENIYIPYGDISEESAELLHNTGAKVSMLWPREEACGAKALSPWFVSANGEVYIKETAAGILSYSLGDISSAGNLKSFNMGGNLINKGETK